MPVTFLLLPEKAIGCLSCWMPMMWSMKMALDANCPRQMEVLFPILENTRPFVVSSTTAPENTECITLSIYKMMFRSWYNRTPTHWKNADYITKVPDNESDHLINTLFARIKYILWNDLFQRKLIDEKKKQMFVQIYGKLKAIIVFNYGYQ